ncbi:MAG: ABC transporter substrate-binding protein [Caldilineaceae bacterium]
MKFVMLSLLVTGLLAGCTLPPTSGAAPVGPVGAGNQKLIWSVEGVNELPGLDPANPQNAQSVLAINLIFGGLVKLDAQLNVVPDGAEKWSVSEDGKTYTFTIRPGLKFADGATVTAQDFADSINRALQPETASYGASFQLQHVVGAADVADGKAKEASGIKVVDAQTLAITTDDTVPISGPAHLPRDLCGTAQIDFRARRQLDRSGLRHRPLSR